MDAESNESQLSRQLGTLDRALAAIRLAHEHADASSQSDLETELRRLLERRNVLRARLTRQRERAAA